MDDLCSCGHPTDGHHLLLPTAPERITEPITVTGSCGECACITEFRITPPAPRLSEGGE